MITIHDTRQKFQTKKTQQITQQNNNFNETPQLTETKEMNGVSPIMNGTLLLVSPRLPARSTNAPVATLKSIFDENELKSVADVDPVKKKVCAYPVLVAPGTKSLGSPRIEFRLNNRTSSSAPTTKLNVDAVLTKHDCNKGKLKLKVIVGGVLSVLS
jgi:hypothetical protein